MKAEILLTIALSCIIGSMIGYSYSYYQFSFIGYENEDLKAEVIMLKTISNNLIADYNEMVEDYNILNNSHKALKTLVDYIIENCDCQDLDS